MNVPVVLNVQVVPLAKSITIDPLRALGDVSVSETCAVTVPDFSLSLIAPPAAEARIARGEVAGGRRAIAEATRPVLGIVTGFPIVSVDPPCAETDGPLGALLFGANLVLDALEEHRVGDHGQVRVEDGARLERAGGQPRTHFAYVPLGVLDGSLQARYLALDLGARNVPSRVRRFGVADDEGGSDGDARAARDSMHNVVSTVISPPGFTPKWISSCTAQAVQWVLVA